MRKWIPGAVAHHKGSLSEWAKKKGFLGKDGNIDLRAAGNYSKKHGMATRERAVNLARALRTFHHSGTPCYHNPRCR